MQILTKWRINDIMQTIGGYIIIKLLQGGKFMKNYLAFENITAYGSVESYESAVLTTGEKAVKIATKDGAWLEFTGNNGQLGGVDFADDKILVVPVYFNETHSVYFKLEFYEDANSPAHADMAMGVLPGFVVNIELALSSLDLNSLFLRRTPGRLKNTSTGIPVKPEKLSKFIFRIPASDNTHTICVGQPYITDESPVHNIPSVPFVDKLGQWKLKEWKGKTKDFDELKANYAKWVDEDLPPMPRSEYGGDLSENFGASGYFRTHNKDGVWYLADPDGYKFYSIGVDCVGTNMSGPVDSIEGLFEELPDSDGEFKAAWNLRRDGRGEFCFNAKNLISLYGDDWQNVWEKLTAKRLKHWGFNTIANWSMRGFGQRNGIPYVIETPFPNAEKNIFRDFPDVFAPEYEKNAAECAKFLNDYREDKLLIGYFLRNEPNWAFGDYNIAHMMITSGQDTYSRREFISCLKEKYNGDIGKLNSAWHINFDSFEDFTKPFTSELSDKAGEDTREFTKKLIHKYVEVPSLACKKIDANHMNLGLRWAWIASDDFYEGSEYMDVFSINCYQKAPSPKELARVSEMSGGKPVMIGEFHSGALDVGLPANALQGVANQSERGYFYSYYMENGAIIPELVGCHYFQYNDQAVTGRFDGENLNIGLVDVCGKPYYDMIEKVIETNEIIYDIRGGKKAPTQRKAVEAIREGF